MIHYSCGMFFTFLLSKLRIMDAIPTFTTSPNFNGNGKGFPIMTMMSCSDDNDIMTLISCNDTNYIMTMMTCNDDNIMTMFSNVMMIMI